MAPVSPNDIYDRKKREKSLRDAQDAISPAERHARFPGEVQGRLSELQAALPKHFSEPLGIGFTTGAPCDGDGGFGLAALDFSLCHDGRKFSAGSINVVDNGRVEFFDRTAVRHEPAVHLTFAELTEDAVIEFLARLTERHLKL